MGFLVALIGLAALGFGLLQKMKGKRILAAPFRKTGEILKNPDAVDAKGMVSTEGAVLAPEPLLSPCSKTPCLYYEVEVQRTWEKQEQTQNGVETKKGASHLHDLKEGTVFGLDDGTGPIQVSLKDGADAELKKTFEDKVSVGAFVPGEIVFGKLRMATPRLPSSERTTGFKAVEKIIPVDGRLFALGKLEGGAIVKPGWRSLMLSPKGRDGLVAATAKQAKFGFIGGGVAMALAIPLFIWGPTPQPKASCALALSDAQPRCEDQLDLADGRSYHWAVSQGGRYTLAVEPPAVKHPMDAVITVSDASGQQVAYAEGTAPGQRTAITQDFAPGTYEVNVRDYGHETVKGGFTYALEIAQAPAEEKPAEADAVAEPAAKPGKGNVIAPLSQPEPKAKGKRVAQAGGPSKHHGGKSHR